MSRSHVLGVLDDDEFVTRSADSDEIDVATRQSERRGYGAQDLLVGRAVGRAGAHAYYEPSIVGPSDARLARTRMHVHTEDEATLSHQRRVVLLG